MKKLGLLVMPLMAISFLASCGGNTPTPPGPTPSKYTLTVNCAYCTPSGNEKEYEEGAKVSFTITPEDTYVLPEKKDVQVSGITDFNYTIASEVATFSCTMPSNAVSVKVTAIPPEPSKYTLTTTCNNGSVTGNKGQYEKDEDVALTFKVNEGYVLPTSKDEIVFDGIDKSKVTYNSGTGSLTFKMPSNAVTVIVTATKPTPSKYTLTVNCTNCTPSGNEKEYEEGAKVSFTITPKDTYVLPDKKDITVTGVTNFNYTITSGVATFTCTMPSNAVTVSVTATAQYTLTLTLNDCNVGGSPTYSKTYTKGQKIESVTVTPNTGYILTSDSIDSSYKQYWAESTGGTYTLSKLVMNSSHIITITATKPTPSKYTLTATCNNGSVTGNKGQYEKDEDVALTFKVNEGYVLPTSKDEIVFDGIDKSKVTYNSGTGSLTFKMPSNAVTVIVTATKPEKTGTVIWKNYDGTVLETDKNVPVGKTPSYDGPTPTKPKTPTHVYEFSGWNPTIKPVVEGDNVYKAVYDEIPITDLTPKFKLVIPNTSTFTFACDGSETLIVDWGDGTFDSNNSHTYTTSGTYTVRIYRDDLTNISVTDNASKSYITEIEFKDKITLIADNAFLSCPNLTSVNISKNVTSIGVSAFENCKQLKTVIFREGSQLTLIGDSAFQNCSSLTSITIPDGATSIANQAFYQCTSLSTIEIPDTIVSVGESVFTGCVLTYTTYSNCRYLCSKSGNQYFLLVEAVNYDITSATIHDSCRVLCAGAFSYCLITSITIPSNVISINDYAFNECSLLEVVNINSGVTSIGDGVFLGCVSLTSVTIPSSVISIGVGLFDGCIFLKTIKVDSKNTIYTSQGQDGKECNAIITKADKTLIAGCATTVIPNNVTSIAAFAFVDCIFLASITIPSSITTIGNYAFYSCSQLQTVIFEKGSQLTSIGAFAFVDCFFLTSITIPSSVTSIGNSAFYSCLKLQTVTFEKGSQLTSIDDSAFFGCSSLTGIAIPSSVTSIGNFAFYKCSKLKTVDLTAFTNEDIDKIPNLGSVAFDNCSENLVIKVANAEMADVFKSKDGWKEYADKIQPAA